MKQIGSNAIPLLLGWVQAEDSALKFKLIVWLREHPSIHLPIKAAADQKWMAYIGFMLLGSEAKPAWPVFIQWTYSTNQSRRFNALYCLIWSKADKETILPVLNRLIHDPDTDLKLFASQAFHFLYPQDAEAAGVYKMFPYI